MSLLVAAVAAGGGGDERGGYNRGVVGWGRAAGEGGDGHNQSEGAED